MRCGMHVKFQSILKSNHFIIQLQLLIPYKDYGNMTRMQRRFNFVHSSIRMSVERSFALLKGKLRRLFRLYVKRFDIAIDHITASFVLHNFIILEGREAVSIC